MFYMVPDVISEDEAKAILDRHLDKLADVCAAGLPDWQTLPPGQTARQSRRTRASWIHDVIADKAREQFDGDPDVEITQKHGFVTLTFEGKLVLRFKKFSGRRLQTSGIRTHQRIAFESQQLNFDGMTVTGVVAGYLLDKLEHEFARLAIVCPLNGQNLWEIDLTLPGQAGGGTVMPIGPRTPTPVTPSVVVESSRKKKLNDMSEE